MRRFFQTSDSKVATLLRVALGVVFVAHGSQKLLGWFGGYGFDATLNGFHQMLGMPAAVATLVIIGEFFGGLGLIFGFLTRLSAAGIMAVMAGAVYFVHAHVGFFMNWSGQQAGEGFEYHILAGAMALSLVALGGGWASVDRLIGRGLARTRRAIDATPTPVEPAFGRRAHG